jgi:hypothetical protein
MAAKTEYLQFLFHIVLNNSDYTASDGRMTMDIIIIIFSSWKPVSFSRRNVLHGLNK